MFKRFTIRQRILVTFLIITLTGAVTQLVIAGHQLQLSTLEFYQHHLETDALLIAGTVSEPLEHYLDGEGSTSIQRLLASLQRDGDYDYVIVDQNYRVIGYASDMIYSPQTAIPITPELVEAGTGDIGSDMRKDDNGHTRLYIAVGVKYEQHILGYLIASRPMQPAYNEVYQQWLELGSTTLPVIVLVIIAGLWLSRTISHPVQALRNSALKMAEGALDTRIQTDSQDEVGQLAHTFNYMAEQIESLMQTQRSFISNAAHELRTPLMTIKLRVEALEDETLPSAERAVYLKELHEEIDHMAALVSSLLVLARIDEGREGRHQQNANLTDTASALQDIVRHWRIKAKEAGLGFDSDIPADLANLPLTPNDLRLVLDNVLGNAIKYTTEGSVTFSARQTPTQMTLEVVDSGTGFDPAQADQLFSRFYRSEEARAYFEGNGLGLSIVQAILNQYGGTISARSAGKNLGATFTIELPLIVKTTPLPA